MSFLQQIDVFLNRSFRQANYLAIKKLGPGYRSVVGLLFVIGGILGFLPVLGFWMLPIGLFLIAMEFPAFRKPLQEWVLRKKHQVSAYRNDS